MHFVWQAIYLLKFYFLGLKAIYTRQKEVSAIRSRAKSGGALPTRGELRLIRTCTQDSRKLIPFAVILLVAEELIPFLALYAPRMLPSTCVLPGQRDRIVAKSCHNQLTALFGHRGVFEAICEQGKQSGFVPLNNLGNAGAVSGLLGLPAWGPSQLNAWRIRTHLNYISSDDEMLRKEGHGQHLSATELKEALLERGMIPVPERTSEEDLRAQLKWWLDTAEVSPEGSKPVSRRLLMIGLIGSQK
jgi:LETM1 and EF-hand domain-containing protein 1